MSPDSYPVTCTFGNSTVQIVEALTTVCQTEEESLFNTKKTILQLLSSRPDIYRAAGDLCNEYAKARDVLTVTWRLNVLVAIKIAFLTTLVKQILQMITIRKALPADAEFIACHAYRLLNFNLPEWRTNEKDKMIKADIQHITNGLLKDDPDDCIFIAMDEEKACGFIRVVLQKDYYTGERHAHVNDIVVIAEAEGKGIGKLLLQTADEWATTKNSRWITLNVFEENKHARAVYEKQGYQVEWIKYLKQL